MFVGLLTGRSVNRSTKSITREARQTGFTIVELMIATMVFSVIVLVITVGVLHFTSDYYKGINSSSTQRAAQNAMDIITHAIQFSSPGGSKATGTIGVNNTGIFCAGQKAFIYSAGKKYDGGTPSTSSGWGLYEYDYSGGCPITIPGSAPAGGVELLGKNMRLTYLNLAAASGSATWNVSLTVAYGDDDLLCHGNLPASSQGGCAGSASAPTAIFGTDIRCKTSIGMQFCAMATLSTTATERLNTNQ